MSKIFNVIFNVGQSVVDNIVAEIERQPELWGAYPVRTSIVGGPFKDQKDIVLMFQDLTLAKKGVFDHYETISYPAMEVLPSLRTFIFGLMSVVRGERLGRVLVSTLPPGGYIDAHKDSKLFSDYYNRFHLCLKDNSQTLFRSGEEYFAPKVGDVFWFDNSLEHEIWNDGQTDRWTVVIDIKKPVKYTAPYEPTVVEGYEDEMGNYIIREVNGEKV